jgi:hypothetical protein
LLGMAQRKNAAAVALGKRRAELAVPGEMSKIGKIGGAAGGPARAAALTKARRKEIAQKAAQARWGKKKGKGQKGKGEARAGGRGREKVDRDHY